MMRRFAVPVLAFAMLALSHVGALAHAYLVESRPADGDLLKSAPATIELLFNESVEVTSLSHVDPAGAVARLEAPSGRAARVSIPAPQGMGEGSHLVSWRVVSEDGHTVSGSLVFSIGRASAGRASAASEPTISQSALALPLAAARFVLLAGLAFGVGALVFCAFVAPAAGVRAVVWSALGLGALAAFLSIGLQGADAHGQGLAALNDRAMWRSGLRLPQGAGGVIALGAFAAAAAGLFMQGRAARILALAALSLGAAALAHAGHARLWRPEVVMQMLVTVHIMCAVCWAGSLLPLASLSMRGDFTLALKRFSTLAAPVYVLLIATGAALAAVQVFGPREAFETAWGMALAAKLAMVAVVTLFAILNRLLFTPAVLGGEAPSRKMLRRSVRIEAVCALVILAAASVWRIAPPPTALGPPDQRAFQIHIHGVQAMASMSIRPARVGPVQIRIEPKAADLSPLRVQEIDLRLAPDAAGVAPIQRKARLASGVNVWEVDKVTIPAPGLWRVQVDLLIDDFDRVRLDAVISLQP
jgi:copper transport protein